MCQFAQEIIKIPHCGIFEEYYIVKGSALKIPPQYTKYRSGRKSKNTEIYLLVIPADVVRLKVLY